MNKVKSDENGSSTTSLIIRYMTKNDMTAVMRTAPIATYIKSMIRDMNLREVIKGKEYEYFKLSKMIVKSSKL